MHNLTEDQLGRYYVHYSDFYMASTILPGKYKLMYDYQNPIFLERISKLVENEIPINYSFKLHPVFVPFNNFFENLLIKFNDERVSKFFKYVFQNCNIKSNDKLNIYESKSIIKSSKNGETSFNIEISDVSCVDILAVELIHELTHFYSVYKKTYDALEYSEVLPMFFEYLMYQEIYNEQGEDIFVNNRLFMLKENFGNLKETLNYAVNPSYLKIDTKFYSEVLASDLCYIDSFEFVLSLISKSKENKEEVNRIIGNILSGTTTCIEEAKRKEIDTSSYKNIKKLIKSI